MDRDNRVGGVEEKNLKSCLKFMKGGDSHSGGGGGTCLSVRGVYQKFIYVFMFCIFCFGVRFKNNTSEVLCNNVAVCLGLSHIPSNAQLSNC